jgi:hypothetical protein
VREEYIAHERGDQNETLLPQAYIYADIFSIRYYHFPLNTLPFKLIKRVVNHKRDNVILES